MGRGSWEKIHTKVSNNVSFLVWHDFPKVLRKHGPLKAGVGKKIRVKSYPKPIIDPILPGH